MQRKAYVFTVGTAIAGAFAFFMRWLQNISILDAETGLAKRGAGISVIIILVLLAAAGVFAYLCRRQAETPAPTDPDKAMPLTLPGEKYYVLVIAVLTGLSALMQFAQANVENWAEGDVAIHKICAFAALVGAVGLLMLTGSKKTTWRCTGTALYTLYGCVWLVTMYKTAASDPVIWRNIIGIFAVCVMTVSAYYIAGYYFGQAHPTRARWSCAMGAFLCIMTLIDGHPSGLMLAYAAAAVMQLLWLYRLLCGMGEDDAAQPAEEGSEAAEAVEAPEAEAAPSEPEASAEEDPASEEDAAEVPAEEPEAPAAGSDDEVKVEFEDFTPGADL